MLPRQAVLLIILAVFIAFSLAVKENFPFSDYPMYTDPDPVSEYYHVTDGDGNPLAVRTLTGITCPQVGKILRKRGDEHAKKLGTKRMKMPASEWEPICRETFADLRAKSDMLPAKMRIMHTTIEYKDGRILETPRVFFAE